ncbi:MAG TPA: four helix bundle protein [Dehalococcoidia bacterium]|nr:four helix bundle protein [Dehalococcoidia bacterium]
MAGIRPAEVESPRYEQLDAWRYADDLAVDVYRLTRRLAPDLRPVVSQILRAAISVPANIAEGYGRGSDREFLQFLTIANASLYEVTYFLHFLQRIDAISAEAHRKAAADCSRNSRVLFGLMKSIRGGSGRVANRRYLSGNSKG